MSWIRFDKSDGQSHDHRSGIYLQYIDGLVQDCSISSALAMEKQQFCTKPSIY